MHICPACSKQLPDDNAFCPACGAPLGRTGQVTATFESTPLPSRPSAARFEPGEVLAGRYRIISRLGKGGMGEVYRADDLRLGQSVALKFLPASLIRDPQRLAYLHDEVRLTRQISHPNVCRVYDIGEAQGQTFLSMEFIDGEDLASLLRRIGRLPADKAIEIARQLCMGLAAAHDQGVIHRDLKPANIMLDGRGQVRITDFGLARLAADVTMTDARSGTVSYMAPEQLAGKEVTIRSDIFALGLVLYEIFTGKKPFHATSFDELVKLHESSTPLSPSSHVPDLDPTVERVILRCLERDPRNRPASCQAVVAALPGGDPIEWARAAGETPSPEMVAAAGESGVWPIRNAIVCAVCIVLGLAGCVLLFSKGMLVGRTGMPLSPDVLKDRAHEHLKSLGIAKDMDWAIGFDHDRGYLRWIRKNDPSADRWDRLEAGRPAALYFWYRQSPEQLIPNLYYPYAGTLEPGRITLAEPAPVKPGMTSVKLDLNGNLLELHHVPTSDILARPEEALPDWDALFKAANLDRAQFTPCAATAVPPVYANLRRAWTGWLREDPEHTVPICIEAAALHGQPVYFEVIVPREEDPSSGYEGTLDKGGETLSAVYFAVVLGAAAVFAPRSLTQGRSDRRGALRLAIATFTILMVVWLFETHHVASIEELRLLIFGLAFALSWSGLLWLTYIALEPYVRQLWPELLITWTRLLAGQWRDPRVGRDLLLGVLFGVLLQLLDQLGRTLPAWLGATTPTPYWDWWIPNTLIRGYWVGDLLINLVYSFRWAFFYILLLFLLMRVLLRQPIVAAVVTVLLSSALWIGTSATLEEPSWYWLFAVAIEAMLLVVLVRVGVFAVIVAEFVWYTVCFPLNTQFDESTVSALAVVLALAAFGFYTSLLGRSLLSES